MKPKIVQPPTEVESSAVEPQPTVVGAAPATPPPAAADPPERITAPPEQPEEPAVPSRVAGLPPDAGQATVTFASDDPADPWWLVQIPRCLCLPGRVQAPSAQAAYDRYCTALGVHTHERAADVLRLEPDAGPQ